MLDKITVFLFRIGSFIRAPFAGIAHRFSLSRILSPFRQFGYSIRTTFGRIFRAPSGTNQARGLFGGRLKLPGGLGNMQEDFAEWRAERAYRKLENERFQGHESANYSQIHLINTVTQQRTIVHIGTAVGSGDAELTMAGDHPPVYLHFRQVDPMRFDAPFLVDYTAGKSVVKVDDVEMKQSAPLHPHSVISVDGHDYQCEFFAWEDLPMAARVAASWLTSAGPVMDHNEDAIGIYQHPRGYLFVVADGVGGGEAGEVISEFAVQYLLAAFDSNVKYDLDWHEMFRRAFTNINKEARRFGRMSAFVTGSTLTAVIIKGWDAYIAHVGDSRLYHYSHNTLRQITTDHLALAQPSGGAPSRTPSPINPTVLSKAIGKADTIEPDLLTIRLQPADRLLLTSDALNDHIEFDELAKLLANQSVGRLPPQLVEIANQHENTDNISIIALDVVARDTVRDSWRATPDKRVYVNYDRGWKLRLDPPRQYQNTPYPIGQRFGLWVKILVALLVIGGVVWVGIRLYTEFPR